MTRDDEPPRLRTLKSELPDQLTLALEDSPDENATPAELATLVQQVQRALRETEGGRERARKLARKPKPRGRLAAVAFSFALGAAAGVLGSSAVFFVISGGSAEPPHAAMVLSKNRKGQPQPLPAPIESAEVSEAPEPEGGATLPPPMTREPVRSPARNSSAEPMADSSKRPAPGPREEFALLARAHAALAKNPGSALALASDHERNFPNGALVQERELVAIDALLRLGRRTEAVGRAARFQQLFPTSVHGRRVDVLLANGESSVVEQH